MEDSELVQMAADYVNEFNHVTFVELRRLWALHCDVVGDYSVSVSYTHLTLPTSDLV